MECLYGKEMEGYIRKFIAAAALLASIATSCDVAKGWAAKVSVPDAAARSRASSATDDFGFRLLKALAKDPKRNTIISPLGIAMAFAMAYNGAAGATKKEMAKTLGLGSLSDDDINRANHYLMHPPGRRIPLSSLRSPMRCGYRKTFRSTPIFARCANLSTMPALRV